MYYVTSIDNECEASFDYVNEGSSQNQEDVTRTAVRGRSRKLQHHII